METKKHFEDNVITRQDGDRFIIKCRLGLWEVNAPTIEKALAEAYRYFRQYDSAGEYSPRKARYKSEDLTSRLREAQLSEPRPPIQDKKGVITISGHLLRGDLVIINQVFRQLEFIPVFIENRFYNDALEMSGYSPFFEPLEPGAMAPRYSVVIDELEDGKIKARVIIEGKIDSLENKHQVEIKQPIKTKPGRRKNGNK